jgi:hypothetical protein
LLHQYNKECGLNFVDKTNCLNCDSPLSTDFCGNCGQEKAQRISFSLLLKIMQRGIIEFKSPLIVTFLGLFINPGKVYREYLNGRRVTYFNPIRYSFWLLTLTLFVAAYFDASILNFGMLSSESEKNSLPITALKIMDFIDSSIIYITFFLALISAVLLQFFFRRAKYSISELYIPCLLNVSQVYLIAVMLILFGYYDTVYGQIFYSTISMVYFVWGISHLFSHRTWLTYLKVILSALLSYVVFTMIIGVIVVFTLGIQEGFNAEHNTIKETEAIGLPINDNK